MVAASMHDSYEGALHIRITIRHSFKEIFRNRKIGGIRIDFS